MLLVAYLDVLPQQHRAFQHLRKRQHKLPCAEAPLLQRAQQHQHQQVPGAALSCVQQ
jgi:hypothetical protein